MPFYPSNAVKFCYFFPHKEGSREPGTGKTVSQTVARLAASEGLTKEHEVGIELKCGLFSAINAQKSVWLLISSKLAGAFRHSV